MQRKFLPYAVPSVQDVEHGLYVAFREDSDALRNHTLPHRVAAGQLVRLTYWDGLLHYTFFRPEPDHFVPKNLQVNRELARLASNRTWYFGWEGMSIGPSRLPHERVAFLSKFEAHRIAGSVAIANKTILDDTVTELLNERLYRLKEVAA